MRITAIVLLDSHITQTLSLLYLSPANISMVSTCLKTLAREKERDVKDLMMVIKPVVLVVL
jgi:hypothetical protein